MKTRAIFWVVLQVVLRNSLVSSRRLESKVKKPQDSTETAKLVAQVTDDFEMARDFKGAIIGKEGPTTQDEDTIRAIDELIEFVQNLTTGQSTSQRQFDTWPPKNGAPEQGSSHAHGFGPAAGTKKPLEAMFWRVEALEGFSYGFSGFGQVPGSAVCAAGTFRLAFHASQSCKMYRDVMMQGVFRKWS